MKTRFLLRPLALVLAAASVSLVGACRIVVDRPATAQGYPAPTATHRYYYRRRPPPPRPQNGSGAGTTMAVNDSAQVDGQGEGLACIDTGAAAVPDCGQVRSAAGCPYAQQKCAAYRSYFDPKVAADALSCLGTVTACDNRATNSCGRDALAKACIDSQLGELCQIASNKCKMSTVDCESLLSGINDTGKEKIAGCIAQGCGGGLEACVDALMP
jgi:hypothetical protein